MNVNQWGEVNQWGGATTLIINASIGGTLTSAYPASISIGGHITINANVGATSTSALPATVTITPAPSEPIIINAQAGSTYSTGYRANVTIGTVTIRIYSGTHYEIPNY